MNERPDPKAFLLTLKVCGDKCHFFKRRCLFILLAMIHGERKCVAGTVDIDYAYGALVTCNGLTDAALVDLISCRRTSAYQNGYADY